MRLTDLGPGDLWAGFDFICDECDGVDGEHADDCPEGEREPDYEAMSAIEFGGPR